MNNSSLHPSLLKPTSDKLWCIPKAGSSLSSLGQENDTEEDKDNTVHYIGEWCQGSIVEILSVNPP